MQLDHFNIAGPWDLIETIKNFYVDVLGFEEGRRPAFDRRGYWLYSDGKPFIHLIESDRHGAAEKRHYLDHIAFRSSNAIAQRKRLEARGVPYRISSIPGDGTTQLFLQDPAGTGLEINFPEEA
jgi:catechol 2,3-dioxygenase-like lactoylglutathione lyase family enzyme